MKKKILVVDNDPLMLEVMTDLLGNEGHQVLTTSDGVSALNILDSYTPEVIFLDMIMPNIDGRKLCQIIQVMPKLKDTYIVVLSAINAEEVNLTELKAHAYIAKGPLNQMAANILTTVNQLDRIMPERGKEKIIGLEYIYPHQITKELLSIKRHFELILGSMSEGILEVTAEQRIVYANLTASSITGIPEEELLQRKFFDLFTPFDREKVKGLLETVGSRPQTIIEDSLLCLNDKLISVNILPVKGDGHSTIIILNDVTERKQAEDKLRENEERFRAMVENIGDIIMILDADGTIRYASPSLERLSGFQIEELLGKNVLEFIHPDDLETVIKTREQTVQDPNATVSVECRVRYKDGSWRYFVFIGKNLLSHPSVSGVVVCGRDISEHKRAEENLERTLGKLRQATRGTIQLLASTVEVRDPYTAGHQQRVADLARSIATEIGLSKEQVDGIRLAGVIHDIGKISIPAEILSKPGRLNDSEFGIIKTHPQIGYDILKKIEFPWPIAQIVYQHHEKIDGSGYPQGLSGEDMLTEAKIMCVADVVEAMASHRPYRPGLGIDKALEEISKHKGILYDSTVVDTCLKLFAEKGYEFK